MMKTKICNKVTGMVKGLLPFYLFTLLPFNALAGDPADYEVVPLPQSIVMQKGEPFVLNGDVQIFAGEDLQQEAEFLQTYLKDITDLSLPLASKREKKKRGIIEASVSEEIEKAAYLSRKKKMEEQENTEEVTKEK